MPELPEVETVCRGLAAAIVGREITGVHARRRDLRLPLPFNLEQALEGKKIKKISRRAKYALIHLDDGQVLIVHLGMSGSLVLYDKKPAQYRKHDHVIVEFAPSKIMVFHDPRRFGLMALATEKTLAGHKLFSALGREPLSKEMNGDNLYKILHTAKAPVKSVIMDQKRIVGVGNIYACEALFRARIHPARSASKITKKEAELLMRSIKDVLQEAIESGGSTLRDYVRSSGDLGYFQHKFSIYGRAKKPCVRCKKPVAVIRQSGRSTFFCASCQK